MAIDGVIITELKTHADDRGFFREIARFGGGSLKPVAQLSATMSYPGVIKAFHYHEQQDDLWYCADGMIQAVLYDRREGSATEGETQVVAMGKYAPVSLYIPRGVVHGYKVLGYEPSLVLYATNQEYNQDDEYRLPHDDPAIGFDWTVKAR
ncbi:MAG: spore coat protein [Candidatus Andersenbacteria bacterium CG10_big_fil_rev_8_21_14_0_10_54_11]|uniref:Spore coat protein n=1 Tax=Candidatus Andersenbacteria bacterium CG10_big_fil_rev_8_21_14_0_10_54_11 TaxID=1974485 RepID=A0A2M6WZH7_9BACT|nr:MAG: spore coat protein [Candidatus Andersenbacteria bacterium CG10_big_fil_rev_8_21_14_0_10_54_11]